MANPYIGEIRLVGFNFPPQGWMFCDGSLLPISEFNVLFALLGTTYGGDGVQTFAIPDLRGRTPIHMGHGPGLSNYVQGQLGGAESASLTQQQIPAHNHSLQVSSLLADHPNPSGTYPAAAPLGVGNVYGTNPDTTMASGTIGAAGSGQPHENRQPLLVCNYIISLFGIFPPHP